MSKRRKLVIGRSSGSILYDELIAKLGELSGAKWGFVKSGRKIQHITSEKITVTIAAPKWNTPEILPKTDIAIVNFDYRQPHWDDIIMIELRTKLLQMESIPTEFRTTIKAWKPSDEFLQFMAYVQEQRNSYPTAAQDAEEGEYDGWLEACMEVAVTITDV